MQYENLCPGCMKEKNSASEICPYCGFDSAKYTPKVHELQPWTILKGRYLLGKVLGSGGFGITYIAMDLIEERTVAIKELFVSGLVKREKNSVILMDPSSNAKDYYRECSNRFQQEAYIMEKLKENQGIVDVYDYFRENGTGYIVMEFLEGMDLLDYLRAHGGKISMEDTFSLLRQIMIVIRRMHMEGFYHRDLSPDNIRCMANGQMKIMDLGGAKDNSKSYKSSIVLVKHGYAPPEQYSSNYKIGPWMDVYAMGATIYRCITGKVPVSSMERLQSQPLVPPRKLGANISPEAEKVLMKSLELETDKRYQDLSQFYHALKKIYVKEPISEPTPPVPPWRNENLPENWWIVLGVAGWIILILIILSSRGLI